ncbi:MAG: DUF2791 family P-loop domain-containing protein [Sphaerochaetaceae bacterium]|jgi:energy-coupling factor transporter ATP-binding protein EcfA2|nr:ATP-binding protein [Sphaerochaetaceae bacterium]MDD2407154.1 DUF2791 family P-loop domain-containing protein [Sphaerochaetaceae bacterium]MDD3997181.1 DUF2791 family P-loop domain-containing protein [Sphaerochaetaceae bacterium]
MMSESEEDFKARAHIADARHSTIIQLAHGIAPADDSVLEQMSVGIDFITDFWRDKYLREYISAGGSKIKFITGQSGSGKTHLLHLLSNLARKEHFVTVSFSAKEVWLHDFKEIYLEILRQSDVLKILEDCSRKVINEMGFDWQDIPQGKVFIDYLGELGLADGITRREIRLQLKTLFLDNPLLDNNFALACSLICGGILGHPFLEQQSRQLLLSFLHGDSNVKLSSLRPLGLSASRITKFNARHMLRSLSEIIRLSGHAGLFITIDDVDILLDGSALNPMHYTKMKRDDTYESLRQLIDDIDSLHNIMFIFAFERALIDNENSGMKSYQALWMRVQNEIVSGKLNRFGDLLDLDSAASQMYDAEAIVQMSRKLARIVNSIDIDAQTINPEQVDEILQLAKTGGISIPRLVNRSTLGNIEGEKAHV